MATESSFNPVAAIVHLLGIAAGLYLGLIAMGAIAPDLPGEEVEPGVSSSAAPGAVSGEDPDSLLRPENLAPALDGLDEQIGGGDGLIRLRIEPGQLNAETGSGEGVFEPADVTPAVATTIVDEIHAQRLQVSYADIGYLELVATRDGPRWYVQLASATTDVSPPWTYTAPLAGTPVRAGGAPPTAIDEPLPEPPLREGELRIE